MADRIIHPGTGFVEYFRTPEEKELADYKDKVNDLENEIEQLKSIILDSSKIGDQNDKEN